MVICKVGKFFLSKDREILAGCFSVVFFCLGSAVSAFGPVSFDEPVSSGGIVSPFETVSSAGTVFKVETGPEAGRGESPPETGVSGGATRRGRRGKCSDTTFLNEGEGLLDCYQDSFEKEAFFNKFMEKRLFSKFVEPVLLSLLYFFEKRNTKFIFHKLQIKFVVSDDFFSLVIEFKVKKGFKIKLQQLSTEVFLGIEKQEKVTPFLITDAKSPKPQGDWDKAHASVSPIFEIKERECCLFYKDFWTRNKVQFYCNLVPGWALEPSTEALFIKASELIPNIQNSNYRDSQANQNEILTYNKVPKPIPIKEVRLQDHEVGLFIELFRKNQEFLIKKEVARFHDINILLERAKNYQEYATYYLLTAFNFERNENYQPDIYTATYFFGCARVAERLAMALLCNSQYEEVKETGLRDSFYFPEELCFSFIKKANPDTGKDTDTEGGGL